MDSNSQRLDEHTGIQIIFADVEYRGSFPQHQVFTKIAIEMNIIIRHQAIAAKIVTQIGAGWKIDAGRASATSKHRGDNFIANFQGFTSSIRFNIFAHFDDFASTLMTQYNWNISI